MMPTSEGGYKLFPLEKLFQSANGNYDIQKKHLNGKGCNVISAGECNNGIVGKSDVLARLFPENTITIDMFGNSYYQRDSYKMVTHARVFSLSPINGMRLSEQIGMYVLAQILHFKKLFSYDNMCSWEKVRRLKIELPLNTQKEIDFDFIESRVRELEEERVRELEAYLAAANFSDCSLTLAEKNALNIFNKGNIIFTKKSIKSILKGETGDVDLQQKDIDGNGCYFINSGVQNMGIKGKTSREAKVFSANTITIDFFGNAYYRPFEYKMATHNHVFSMSGDIIKNENVGLYLTVAMSYFKHLFSFSDMGTLTTIKDLKIALPLANDGSLDFAFMENFINAIKKQTIARVKEYIEREHKAYMQVVDGSENSIEPKITPILIHDTYLPGCIPLYTLRAACGYFEDGEVPEAEGWIDATGKGFSPDSKRHFAIHAKGDSMLPKIKDGDICVFEWYDIYNAGSRNGEIVLTQSREYDPEYGGKYTIKRYHSEKLVSEEGWQHTKVELCPLNPDFDTVELTEDDDVRTIGIFKCVL